MPDEAREISSQSLRGGGSNMRKEVTNKIFISNRRRTKEHVVTPLDSTIPKFKDLRIEAERLAADPDLDAGKEFEFKTRKARLMREVNDAGFLRPFQETIRMKISNSTTYREAQETIRKLNTQEIEKSIAGDPNSHWKANFEGIFAAYKEHVLERMETEYQKANGTVNEDIAEKVEKEGDLMGWSVPLLEIKDIIEKEKLSNTRSFNDVQKELRTLAQNPDRQKERDLRAERDTLIAWAKKVGLFDQLKDVMYRTQLENQDYNQAYKEIAKIDIDRLENSLFNTLDGLDEKVPDEHPLRGILDEYRDVALLNMKAAWLEGLITENVGDIADHRRRLINLRRQIDLRGWGIPPTNLEGKAIGTIRDKIEKRRQQRQHQSRPNQPQANLPRPEDYGKAVADALGAPTPEKQRRNFLEIERNGRGEVQIPSLDHNTWEGLSRQERDFWLERLRLSNARAKKQNTYKAVEFFPNPYMQEFTKEGLNTVTNHKGVPEATASYLALFTDKNFYNRYKERMGMTAMHPSEEGADQRSLELFRRQFEVYLRTRLGLNQKEALDAEQVAYNFVYMTNELEAKKVKSGLKNFVDFKTSELMHMKAKVIESVVKSDDKKAKAWPSGTLFGEWAYRRRKDIKRNPDIVPLPDQLFPSLLQEGVLENNPLVGLDQKGRDFISGKINRVPRLDWNRVEEYPFNGPYYLNRINQAQIVYAVFSFGQLPDNVTPSNFADVYSSLISTGASKKIAKETIESMIGLIHNKEQNWIHANNYRFKPLLDPFSKIGYINWMRKNYPSIYSIIFYN